MIDPVVLPRASHGLSRRAIDPDALKVLYRLRDAGYTAYLVGGSVRDLLLERRPKDFDIGTSAHPSQVKRLFRNCWIIGRRFRLAHVRFGTKIIEVATFRRQMPAPDEAGPDLLIHRDNTFGTPEEDAFRRDFTVNALFYDIATFSIIDYVGGLRDLQARVVRAIGIPEERFHEDPVRMLRAIALAARLGFAVDPLVLAAIERHRAELARAAPARLMDEYYKILRSGASAAVFQALSRAGLLAAVSPALDQPADHPLWASLETLDAYRRRFGAAPGALTNAVLLGSLLVPLGFTPRSGPTLPGEPARWWLGLLPAARRDIERLRHVLLLQRRLRDARSPRAEHSVLGRSAFPDALTWLELDGREPALAERWRHLHLQASAVDRDVGEPRHEQPRRRRRRRRRFPAGP